MHLSSDYRHRPKWATPDGLITCGTAALKWYDLTDPAQQITAATKAKARQALAAFGENLASDLAGFVILHQCSASFCFLLISTWRGNNELWQSVHYSDAPPDDFAPFPAAYPDAAHLRPTFCVWELGIVAHEARAWQRYLTSSRSAADLDTWRSDCLSDQV